MTCTASFQQAFCCLLGARGRTNCMRAHSLAAPPPTRTLALRAYWNRFYALFSTFSDMTGAAHTPPFHLLLLAQSMSVCSELFGQRVSRSAHAHSHTRMLISMSLYCAAQAFIVLGIAQLALPHEWTGGQGSLSMWSQLAQHPGLWVNAVNNSIYWLALVHLLREPFGAVLVVLAFLFGTFLVDPFQRLVGMPTSSHLTPGAVVLGVTGTLLCIFELSLRNADRTSGAILRSIAATLRCCAPRVAGTLRRQATALSDALPQAASISTATGGCYQAAAEQAPSLVHADKLFADGAYSVEVMGVNAEGSGERSDIVDESLPLVREQSISGGATAMHPASSNAPVRQRTASALSTSTLDSPPTVDAAASASACMHSVSILVAFCVLFITTAIGIVVATYYDVHGGLSSFGYTAIDQCLLPFTTLPLTLMLVSIPRLRSWLGEDDTFRWHFERLHPAGMTYEQFAASRNYWHVLHFTWAELNRAPPATTPDAGRVSCCSRCRARCMQPWKFWWTLIPFHSLEFCRSLLFFYLITQFDVDATYMQMTLLRIVLCWIAALFACSFLASWVGISPHEARRTLHPINMAIKLIGSVFLCLSILELKGLL
ncbi:hypothetical protein EON66_01990 [archaeon]|nr:MAG: hypothetical protein EON66_01990 [archaeon]